MYECPNCSANLKYHICKQMLYCEHCETTMDPYHFHKEQDAEEYTEYEVTLFTCPQCGGEIISEDTTAATFCSYCGSSTILDSRISKEKCPSYIIPFSKTEVSCRKAYKKMMKQAIFAPDALKDDTHIKKFRGIYMPYWVYSFEKKGPITFKGSRNRRKGDYIITKYYAIDCDIDAEYKGIAFDASSTFCDSLSNAIAPFDIKKGKPFTPAFLSGFYADTSDVDNSLYILDAEKMVVDVQCEQIQKKSTFAKYNISEPRHMASLKNALVPSKADTKLALFPVWFLSYRKDDRVAYAVVNGQTGKIAADLPVDTRKYLLGSLILAVPLFILLNLFFTLKPNWLLLIVAILALICTIISNVQISRIMRRESGEDDKGLQYRKQNSSDAASLPLSAMRDNAPKNAVKPQKHPILSRLQEKVNNISLKKKGAPTINKTLQSILIALLAIIVTPFLFSIVVIFARHINFHMAINIFLFLSIILSTAPIIYMIVATVAKRKDSSIRPSFHGWKKKVPLLAKPLIGIAVAVLILLINPVSDLFYYLGAIFCMSMVAWVVTDIMKRHNILSTRKLPQLNNRGGDEVA